MTVETTPNEFEIPQSEQKNTTGLGSVGLPDFNISGRPKPSDTLTPATPKQAANLLHTAQSIVFLPVFRTTDHIFHGDTIDSWSVDEGFPTVRPALIDGANFHLQLMENFNYGYFQFILHTKGDRTLYLHMKPQEVDTDATTADWVQDGILSPMLGELMLRTQGSQPNLDESADY